MTEKKHSKKEDEREEEFVVEDEVNTASIDAQLKKLRTKLKLAEEEKMTNLSGWQRAKADYVNLKAESAKKYEELVPHVKIKILEEFLPLADSFEVAMANKEAWETVAPNWRKGVEYIYGQLVNILEAQGITAINPLGQIFEPSEHESVAIAEVKKKEEDGRVLAVIKKGYRLGSTVLRPAQVKIGVYNN